MALKCLTTCRDVQKTAIVEETNYTVDDRKLVLGDVKPEVETFDKLSSDFFAGVSSDVAVWFQQRLAWRS